MLRCNFWPDGVLARHSYQWDRLFAANGSLLSLQRADLLAPPDGPDAARALPAGTFTPELLAKEITLSAVRYDYSSNWASSTGRSFPCWISS